MSKIYLALLLILISCSNINAQKVKIQATFLQSIKLEDIPNQYASAIATEGIDLSRSKKLYTQDVFICRIYSDIAFIKISNKVFALKSITVNTNKSGYTQIFSNNNFRLIVKCNKVQEIPNAGIEGWNEFEGNIELNNKNGDRLEYIQGYYAVGMG